MGVDLHTYTLLLELQHRDITPEDYDTLQTLDSNTKRKTLSQIALDREFPAWVVPEDGKLPARPVAAAEVAPSQARRRLMDDLDSAAPATKASEAEEGLPVSSETTEAPTEARRSLDVGVAGVEGPATAKTAKEAAGEDAGVRTCSICLEPFAGGQFCRSLPCSHVFHRECIDEWLTQSSRACPEDGLPVFPDPVTEEENAGDGGLPLDPEEAEDGAAGYEDGYEEGSYGYSGYGGEYDEAMLMAQYGPGGMLMVPQYYAGQEDGYVEGG